MNGRPLGGRSRYEQGSHAYHSPLLLQLKEEVSQSALILALHAIVARHEILRTVFVQDELGIDYQKVKNEPLEIKTIACKTLKHYQEQLKKDINQPFDLQQNYPIRVCFYAVEKTREVPLLSLMLE